MLTDCDICAILERPEKEAVYWENRSWLAIVSREQSLLSRLMIILKRHETSQSKLTGAEVIDRWRLFTRFERQVMRAFGAATVNDECLMNHAFRAGAGEAHPHVHSHWKPRYERPVEFAGLIFNDPDFGERADPSRRQMVTIDLQCAIAVRLLEGR